MKKQENEEVKPLNPLQMLVACVVLGPGMACMLGGSATTVLLLACIPAVVVYMVLKK